MWLFCLISAMIICLIGLICVLINQYTKNKSIINFRIILIFCVSVALTLLYYPIFMESYDNILTSLLLSIQSSVSTFVFNMGYEFIEDAFLNTSNHTIYMCFLLVLYIIAPLLTVTAIASCFTNFYSGIKCFFCRSKTAYVFSKLNDKSYALAKSVYDKNKNIKIIFTDVTNEYANQNGDLINSAKKIHAIFFSKDITDINYKPYFKNVSFFVISEDEDENLHKSLNLMSNYRSIKNTMLYIFTTSIQSELLLKVDKNDEIKIRRINDVRSLINRILYEKGISLFNNANKNDKTISAVIIGLGRHGTEMLKALSWYCQMDGYKIKIDAFDKEETAESKFSSLCPELMDKKYNGVYVDGEAYYDINIHSGVDVETSEFVESIKKINSATYVFISLGDDNFNTKIAVTLRMLFERMGIKPQIQSVMQNCLKNELPQYINNFKNQSYNIEFVGDIETSYSDNVIINSELENEGLALHQRYNNDKVEGERMFWLYEYNYNSSIASAIHNKLKIDLNIPGANKQNDELNTFERTQLENIEHIRWNAYMRSEGYIYDKIRNDLAKTHKDLIPYENLSEEEKRKDSRVSSK